MAFRIYGACMSALHGEYMSNGIYIAYIVRLYVHVCVLMETHITFDIYGAYM